MAGGPLSSPCDFVLSGLLLPLAVGGGLWVLLRLLRDLRLELRDGDWDDIGKSRKEA